MACRYGICNRALFQGQHGLSFTLAANGIEKVFESSAASEDKQRQQKCDAGTYERLLLS